MLKYKKLAPIFLVQLFTWLGLFSLFIYAAPAITKYFFNAGYIEGVDFEKGKKWVGICFVLYTILGADKHYFHRWNLCAYRSAISLPIYIKEPINREKIDD